MRKHEKKPVRNLLEMLKQQDNPNVESKIAEVQGPFGPLQDAAQNGP